MADDKNRIRIQLTDEQRAQLEKAVGKKAEAIELTIEELEERIAPWGGGFGAGI